LSLCGRGSVLSSQISGPKCDNSFRMTGPLVAANCAAEGILPQQRGGNYFFKIACPLVYFPKISDGPGGVRLPMPMSMRIRDTEGVAKVQN